MEPSKYRCNLIAKVVSGEAGFRYGFVYRSACCGWGRVTRVCTSPLLAGVIFEKYILVFQIQIFGFKYKIQEGLKPDRNNAREGGIVGRDAEGARRGLCAACPPRPRGATAVRRPDRFQWPVVQVVPHQADVCAHTVAHRSLCLTPGRSALPTKIRTPVTGVFRSSGADASMLPRIPSSEGPTGACQPTASRAWTTLPADVWPRRLQGTQRPNYAARTHETRHRAF